MIGLDSCFLIDLYWQDSPRNKSARSLYQQLENDNSTKLAIYHNCFNEFLHVITDSKRFENPFSIKEAIDVIDFSCCDDQIKMYSNLLDCLYDDIYNQHLLCQDIMIIDMDKFGYVENSGLLKLIQRQKPIEPGKIINIHSAGALSPEDFLRKDSIVYSSIRRAKGNETYMVYIVNAQKCCNSLQKISDRNSLFTAITRSKGWVRVLGYGDDMVKLCEEFKTIKEHNF